MSARSDTLSETALTGQSSDRELWEAVQQGSARAWEILVRRYEALVYTIAVRAGLSLTEAGDCFQQTWYQLFRNRKRITMPDRLSAWITTTAKRESLRLRRDARRFVDSSQTAEQADPRPAPDQELESLERKALLESALSRLDGRCEKLLRALFLEPESSSYDDLAERLGMPKNSLGPTRSRCLARMHAIAKEEGWIDVL